MSDDDAFGALPWISQIEGRLGLMVSATVCFDQLPQNCLVLFV
mgnify:CR=1 FL=1